MQAKSQAVDGEVPAVKVLLDVPGPDPGQGGGSGVGFLPGGGQVDPVISGEAEGGRSETGINLDPDFLPAGESPGQPDRAPAALNRDINIQVFPVKEQVTDESAVARAFLPPFPARGWPARGAGVIPVSIVCPGIFPG